MAPTPPRRMFYADDIIASLDLDPNQTYVPLPQLCEALGIDRDREERRLNEHEVLSMGARTLTVELETYRGPALCLRVDLVPLWLCTLDAAEARGELRPRLELFQREAASLFWQSFKPQGFSGEDELLPNRHDQSPSEIAYAASLGIATLARQQMLIERQLSGHSHDEQGADPYAARVGLDDPEAELLARAVRRVAQAAAERTRRNEYAGVYSGLYRQFGITSYRRMPRVRLNEALEWLERWRGDIMGEPEPPPDI